MSNGPEFFTPDATASTVQPVETSRSAHPVLDLIRQQLDTLMTIGPNPNLADQCKAYSNFAEGLAEIEFFSLTSPDIINIWSSKEINLAFPSPYQRYALARMLSLAYAIQGLKLNKTQRKRYPIWHFTDLKLPEGLKNSQIREKLDEVERNYNEAANTISGDVGRSIRDSFGNALSVPNLALNDAGFPHS